MSTVKIDLAPKNTITGSTWDMARRNNISDYSTFGTGNVTGSWSQLRTLEYMLVILSKDDLPGVLEAELSPDSIIHSSAANSDVSLRIFFGTGDDQNEYSWC